MADKPTIKVTGHLEERMSTNGKNSGLFYRMMLAWTDEDGKRQHKSKTTGLPVKGNKTRAKDMLADAIKEQESLREEMALSAGTLSHDGLLFADFMEEWLESVNPVKANRNKTGIKLNTFGGYQMNVKKAIAPWFREHGILLRDLTADDINDFYDNRWSASRHPPSISSTRTSARR